MTTSRVRLICFCFALCLFACLSAFAAPVRLVRLSLAQGDVQIDRNSGDGWEQAIVNMPVITGVRIYAAENSKAELEFEDGSNVRLAGPAQVTLLDLSSAPNGSPVNSIQVDSGELYVNARLRNHDDFHISAYTGESFAITKPSHLRFTVKEQTASLAMNDGEAQALSSSDSDNSTIRSGQTYNYILGQPASAARLESVPVQPEDAWNQQRDSYNNQNASAGAQYSGSDDASAPGVADLGYYGNYSDVPGYGESWQPNDVGPDWNPYDNGAWCYYPDWGWTFVSAYPWGWTPFYYGNWFYVHGRGWWWRPGGNGHGLGGWHSAPLLANAPKGFSTPHPPVGAAHRTVAVAGSNLRVGPIGITHASVATTIAPSRATTASNVLRAGATSTLRPSVQPSAAIRITGQKGSYTITTPSGSQTHRPPVSVPAPRSVSTSLRSAYNSSATNGYASTRSTSSTPRVYTPPHTYNVPVTNVPVAPPVRLSSPPSVSAAPPVSHPTVSQGSAVSHSSGFSGGGAAVSHGGGFSGGGGGRR
jgi:uncharacterized membrane protein YgcG